MTRSSTQAGSFFDGSTLHSIAVEFDEGSFEELLADYAESDEKSWIEADVTIDGRSYERAGMRLKGNSSLRGLGSGEGSAESPEDLPWLIRLDKFVEGQRHDGYADIVIRANSTETSLNESVALDLLAAAGLASQLASSTTFSVNGSQPVLRLAIEHPDDDAWQERSFDSEGALYKAESSGDWSYRGADPESYADVFDQEGGKKVADLTPLIEFLQFVNESDDETFSAELGDRLDVESFATYLAMMELTENFDDIDGPGNNSYLWWDAETAVFTIVPWDMNLAFGQMAAMGGPGGPGGSAGGMGRPAGGVPPGGLQDGQRNQGNAENTSIAQPPRRCGPWRLRSAEHPGAEVPRR